MMGLSAGKKNGTSSHPLVSVIMNCFNSDKYLSEAIDSVFTQTFTDWEIIFWDNVSTDKSPEVAKNYGPRVRYFRGKNTVPLGQARNLAIEKARGKYIAFLDCDDIWEREKIEKQVCVLEKDEDLSFVFTDTVKFDDKGDIRGLSARYRSPEGKIFREILRGNFITLSSAVVRRSALDALGSMFDAGFHMSEDWDLWLRLSYSGKAASLNEPLTKWRVNPGSLTHKKFGLYSLELECMIDKFISLYPGFESQYADEIKKLRKTIVFDRGMGLWFEDCRSEARIVFKPFVLNDRKFFLAYTATFMPFRFMRPLERAYFKFNMNRFL
jgi:glycosyltransferase involved in cell wall biosynthesis